eukprot:g31811.t1
MHFFPVYFINRVKLSIVPRDVQARWMSHGKCRVTGIGIDLHLQQEARNTYRKILSESARKLNAQGSQLGNCIEKARPYYEARRQAKESSQWKTPVAYQNIRRVRGQSVLAITKEKVMGKLKGLKEVTSKLDKGEPVDVIYLDFQKAFDKVPDRRLLNNTPWCSGQSAGMDRALADWQKAGNTDKGIFFRMAA